MQKEKKKIITQQSKVHNVWHLIKQTKTPKATKKAEKTGEKLISRK